MKNLTKNNPSVTVRQVTSDDVFYKAIEKNCEENGAEASTLWFLLFGEDTQQSTPKLLAIDVEGQLAGYAITFDFFQATYISFLQINEAYRGLGLGAMLLQRVCSNPDRTYVLLSEVAMSDSEQLSVCVRRKMFYLENGFRTVPVKWASEYRYNYDVHVKGPDLELGSLLAALRKGQEIWVTASLMAYKNSQMAL